MTVIPSFLFVRVDFVRVDHPHRMVTKGDVRRLFLQSVLSRGVMSEKLAQEVWARCKTAVQSLNFKLYLDAF